MTLAGKLEVHFRKGVDVKKLIAIAALTACTFVSAASAQEVDYLGATPTLLAEVSAQPANLPAGVMLVDLERWRYKEDTFTARPLNTPGGMKHPGKREGVLGFISYYPFEGSVTLYACLANNWMDSFSSLDPNCEGQMKTRNMMPITGYMAGTQLPGTVPLYRCTRNIPKVYTYNDHFDTLDPNCEGKYQMVFEGILGYIWI